jgi:two-component system, chemotaxis family, chemotaxis protein CheY
MQRLDDPGGPGRRHAMASPSTPDKPSLLLVDDNDDAREALAYMIAQTGICHVVEARNGEDALRVLREGLKPCLILLDLMMPGLDGWAFRTEQRKLGGAADIPVVIYSGSPTVEEDAVRLEVAGCLRKPLDFDRLLQVVEEHCGR